MSVPFYSGTLASIHFNAFKQNVSPIVIITTDLNLALVIANKLDSYFCISNARGTPAYSGYYRNTFVTVVSTGMGMFSTYLYAEILFKYYGVKYILKCDTCKSLVPDKLKLKDILAVDSSYVSDNIAAEFNSVNVQSASKVLCDKVKLFSNKIPFGSSFCSLLFSCVPPVSTDSLEVESYSLYLAASRFCGNALSLLVVSDVVDGSFMTESERAYSMQPVINLCLNLTCILKDEIKLDCCGCG